MAASDGGIRDRRKEELKSKKQIPDFSKVTIQPRMGRRRQTLAGERCAQVNSTACVRGTRTKDDFKPAYASGNKTVIRPNTIRS